MRNGAIPAAGRCFTFTAGLGRGSRGPFVESKALITGYWILQMESMDEAVEWAKRFPFEAMAKIYPGEYGAGRSRSAKCSSWTEFREGTGPPPMTALRGLRS